MKKQNECTNQTFLKDEKLPIGQSTQNSSEDKETLINQQSSDESDQSCPICFETFDNGPHGRTFTSCGHSFCEICLQRIMKLKPFCPFCRQHLQQDKFDGQHSEPIQLDQNTSWDPDVVRAFFSQEFTNEDGRHMRTVHLSDGQATNIHVSPGAKINISPGANIIINGKRVQNPSDCSQQ
jgi:hypothetical protein